MKKNEFSPLFERTYIGNLGVRNRIVMAPMGAGLDNDGTIGEMGLDYYGARAKGGTGLIIPGYQNVTTKTDPLSKYFTGVGTGAQLYGWTRLAERCHAYGSAVILSLGCGLGPNGRPIPGTQLVGASDGIPTYWAPGQGTRGLTTDEVKDIVESYGRAAASAKLAGVDGLEIHAHLGYLIDTFLSAHWNKRTDEYGGSFENRMRLVTEIYQAMRAEVGSGMPIMIRMVLDHKTPEGRKTEESLEMIRYLDNLGIDCFSLDEGSYQAYEWSFPTIYMGEAPMAYVGDIVRAVTKKPIMIAGSLTPETMLKAVNDGTADFVMLGRGLLADAEFANKLYEGRRKDVRPCLRCNELCTHRALAGRPRCSVNVQCGAQYPIVKSESPKKVVVVGGGVGGLEAAQIAARKGHDVTLCDKSDKLGGQLVPAGVPAFKSTLRTFLEYEKVQNEKLGVKIKLKTEITPDSPELADADRIIIALGAKPIIPGIKGIDNPKVLEVTDSHLGDQNRIGRKVVIAGGGMSGLDCGIELAMEGKDVTIVEMMDVIVPKTPPGNKESIMKSIEQYNISLLTGHKVLEFTKAGVKVDARGEVKELAADTVILAFGTKPNREVVKAILDQYPHISQAIGDCTSIGQVGEAVRAGFFAGWGIE